jgi:hypothetical protein
MSYLIEFYIFFPKALTYTPGVSIILTNPSIMSYYLRSLVIPGYLSTIAKFAPIIQLNKEDFPQLGKPIKDTLNFVSFGYFIVYH